MDFSENKGNAYKYDKRNAHRPVRHRSPMRSIIRLELGRPVLVRPARRARLELVVPRVALRVSEDVAARVPQLELERHEAFGVDQLRRLVDQLVRVVEGALVPLGAALAPERPCKEERGAARGERLARDVFECARRCGRALEVAPPQLGVRLLPRCERHGLEAGRLGERAHRHGGRAARIGAAGKRALEWRHVVGVERVVHEEGEHEEPHLVRVRHEEPNRLVVLALPALAHRVAPQRTRLQIRVHRRQLKDLAVALLGVPCVILALLSAGLLQRAFLLVASLPRLLLALLAAVGHRAAGGAELQVGLWLLAAVALAAGPDAHALLAARDEGLGTHLDGRVHPCTHLWRQVLLLLLGAAVGLLGLAGDAAFEHLRACHGKVE
eukprot:scaffold63121_cov69-Phaeocystis_antarctica.AAC.4